MLDTIIYIPTILAYAFISLLVAILSFIVIYVSHKVYVLIYENLPMPDSHILMSAEDNSRTMPITPVTIRHIHPDLLPVGRALTPNTRSELTLIQGNTPLPMVTAWDQSSEMTPRQKHAPMKPIEAGRFNDVHAANINGKLRTALRIVVKVRPSYLAYVVFEAGVSPLKRTESRVDTKLIKYFDRLSTIPHGDVMQQCQQVESPSQSDNGEPEVQLANGNDFPDYQPSTNVPRRKSLTDYQRPVTTNALMDRNRDRERPIPDAFIDRERPNVFTDRNQDDYPIIIPSDAITDRERPYTPIDMQQSDMQQSRNAPADDSRALVPDNAIMDRERADVSTNAHRPRKASLSNAIVDKPRPDSNVRSDRQRPVINSPPPSQRLGMNMDLGRQLLSNSAIRSAQRSNNNQPRRRQRMSSSNAIDGDDEDELNRTPSGMALVRPQGRQ